MSQSSLNSTGQTCPKHLFSNEQYKVCGGQLKKYHTPKADLICIKCGNKYNIYEPKNRF